MSGVTTPARLFAKGPAQFPFAHAALLRAIAERGQVRPSYIPEARLTAEHAMVALGRLLKQGLVSRRRVTSNFTWYGITVEGRRVLAAWDLLRQYSGGRRRAG